MNTSASTNSRPPAAVEGLEQLFARFQAELLGALLYLVGNEQDARDALQDTFIKCWKNREKTHGVANLKAWVFRIALNTARDLRKTAWRRRRRPLTSHFDSVVCDAAPSDARLAVREEADRIRQAIQRLRPEEKEVFLLRQNGELTFREIAEMLALPIGTVKTRMRMAVRQLRLEVG